MGKRTDISQQIRKYLNGELDARAMHQLEKEALNDPFLAEALEGYEKAGGDQQRNLGDIHKRLQERIREKNRRIVLWRTISIAASVIVVLMIGGLWLYHQQSIPQPKLMARVEKTVLPEVKSAPAIDTVQQFKKPGVLAGNEKYKHKSHTEIYVPAVSEGDNSVAPATGTTDQITVPIIKKDSSLVADNSLSEIVVTGYGTQKKKNLTGSAATIPSKDLKQEAVSDVSTGLQGKVSGLQVNIGSSNRTITGTVTDKTDGTPMAGVTVKVRGTDITTQTNSAGKFRLKVPVNAILQLTSVGYEPVDLPLKNKGSLAVSLSTASTQLGEVVVTSALGIKKQSRSVGYSTATISSKEQNSGTITGIVTDKNDGTPIPGVTVKIKGTDIGTQTNGNGEFTLNNVPDKSTLDIAFIGYNTAEILVTHKKKSLAIAMQPSNNSLAEVVVTGYGTSNDDYEAPPYQGARPAEGWRAFKKYLQDHNTSPDGKAGTVKLSFMVNADNSLSDFKIIKSVGAKTDSTAIALVKNGPVWYSNTNHTAQKVKVKLKFTRK